jgi:hypothetical protein
MFMHPISMEHRIAHPAKPPNLTRVRVAIEWFATATSEIPVRVLVRGISPALRRLTERSTYQSTCGAPPRECWSERRRRDRQQWMAWRGW